MGLPIVSFKCEFINEKKSITVNSKTFDSAVINALNNYDNMFGLKINIPLEIKITNSESKISKTFTVEKRIRFEYVVTEER